MSRKVWSAVIYPFPNVFGCTIEVICPFPNVFGCTIEVIYPFPNVFGCTIEVIYPFPNVFGCTIEVIYPFPSVFGCTIEVIYPFLNVFGCTIEVIYPFPNVFGCTIEVIYPFPNVFGCTIEVIYPFPNVFGCTIEVIFPFPNIFGCTIEVIYPFPNVFGCTIEVIYPFPNVFGCTIEVIYPFPNIFGCTIEVIYPFPNVFGCTIEVCEWVANFLPHLSMEVISYPSWDKCYSMLVSLQQITYIKTNRETTWSHEQNCRNMQTTFKGNFRESNSLFFIWCSLTFVYMGLIDHKSKIQYCFGLCFAVGNWWIMITILSDGFIQHDRSGLEKARGTSGYNLYKYIAIYIALLIWWANVNSGPNMLLWSLISKVQSTFKIRYSLWY